MCKNLCCKNLCCENLWCKNLRGKISIKTLVKPCSQCEDKCCCCIPAWAGIIILTFLKIVLLLPAMVYGGRFVEIQYIATLLFLVTLSVTVYAVTASLYDLNNLVLILVVTIYLHFAFAIGVLDVVLSFRAQREKDKLQKTLLCVTCSLSVVVNFYLLIIVCTYYKLHRRQKLCRAMNKFASTIRVIV